MPTLRACECPNCDGEGWVQLVPNEDEAPEDATTLCPECLGTRRVAAAVLSSDMWEQMVLD
jgi:DnaJ-class molecular chaperone